MEILNPETLAIPISAAVSIAIAVISAYKMVDSVKDLAQSNKQDIGYLQKEQATHKDVHKTLEDKIEQLRKGEEKIMEDIGGLKQDIATLSTKMDIVIDQLKK